MQYIPLAGVAVAGAGALYYLFTTDAYADWGADTERRPDVTEEEEEVTKDLAGALGPLKEEIRVMDSHVNEGDYFQMDPRYRLAAGSRAWTAKQRRETAVGVFNTSKIIALDLLSKTTDATVGDTLVQKVRDTYAEFETANAEWDDMARLTAPSGNKGHSSMPQGLRDSLAAFGFIWNGHVDFNEWNE